MAIVWVVGTNQPGLKVFEEKNDAINHANIHNLDMVEAELIWIEPPPFPLPPSKYICTKCKTNRPKWFDLCYNDNLMNVDVAWCDTCNEDTGFKKEGNE